MHSSIHVELQTYACAEEMADGKSVFDILRERRLLREVGTTH